MIITMLGNITVKLSKPFDESLANEIEKEVETVGSYTRY